MKQSPKQLLIIGDSNVYGWGDIDGGGWCERLRRNWMNDPKAPIIYPLGIRGDGIEKVAKRWRSEFNCRGELRRKMPDGLLLHIGINDTARIGRPDGRPQLSSEAFQFGFERVLNGMKDMTNVMVLGLTPVNEKAMPFAECLWYSNHACSNYESKIEETCLELDVPFLPLHKEMLREKNCTRNIEPDGIHLNSEGHHWIYKRVSSWNTLVKWSGI